MAFFTDDGKLKLLQTSDLLNYLDTRNDDERINILDGDACLGQRAVAWLLTESDGTTPWTFYGIAYGDVKHKDYRYEFRGSRSVAEFIGDMIDAQNEGDEECLTVAFLRGSLEDRISSFSADGDSVAE